MRSKAARRGMFAAFVLIAFCWCASGADVQAQARRTKRSRRITNPVRSSARAVDTGASSNEASIVSTADEDSAGTRGGVSAAGGQEGATGARRRARTNRATPDEGGDDARRRPGDAPPTRTDRSNDKLDQIEAQQRLADAEQRATQRAESLRAQMIEMQEKEAALQTRLEQIEEEIRPENIERSIAVNGSTRPEDARAARRRALESERTRVRSRLDTLTAGRARLEASIASADAEVDRLRARLNESGVAPVNNSAAGATTNSGSNNGGTTATPTPVPTTGPVPDPPGTPPL